MQRSLTCNTIKVDKFNPNYRFNREYVYEETWTVHCKTWCPAHIAFQGYIEKASEWKFDEALELIKKNNLPAVCGKYAIMHVKIIVQKVLLTKQSLAMTSKCI